MNVNFLNLQKPSKILVSRTINIKFFSQIFFIFSIVFSAFEIQSQEINNKFLLLVHKTPTCGCCKKWVKHLESNGISTTTKDHQGLQEIKEKYSIKSEYRSCHTAVSEDGYVFEGHVPSKYIAQFLAEKNPDAIGLSVPGMPLGSPGMEIDNRFTPYEVLILYKDGTSSIYAEINQR
tara:strand:+ start:379 stop:909 length:531 start_codon:yes stop_codon:yes gene_type:complete